MILLLFCILLDLLILRSFYMLIWRNKKDKKFFAPMHFTLILVSGFFSFCVMFLMALGSTGHFVAGDFEEMVGDWTLGVTMAGTLLGITGFFITIVVWIKNIMYNRNQKKL